MNLAAKRWARRLDDFVMRLGCVLVSASLLASLIFEPPRAKAFELTSSMVTALAGGFLNACGLAPVVSGMSSSGDVNEALARLIQEYLTAEVPGADIVSWLGDVAIQVSSGNKLIIPAVTVGVLTEFAQWVKSKYATKPGNNVIYANEAGLFSFHKDAEILSIDYPYTMTFRTSRWLYNGAKYSIGIDVPDNIELISYKPKREEPTGNFFILAYITMNNSIAPLYKEDETGYWYRTHAVPGSDNVVFVDLIWVGDDMVVPDGTTVLIDTTYSWVKYADAVDMSVFGLDVAEDVTIPEGLTEDQSLALDVGAVEGMGIEDILQGILDAILAGELAASAEIVDTAEAPVEPEDPDPPVVPVIPEGLDKLGAALTSRFPFSIPWDVYKGVKLLAAPAKAPYFEVDFMAPIARRVGGWKGSTRIVLDFSEYEIIGQVCRWSSTIGFCLMLAAGTKRLIWTA